MDLSPLDVKDSPAGASFRVRVQPRASRSALIGLAGNSLKLALTSPPAEGAANAACVEFFAALFGVAKSRVTVAAGLKSRDKTVRVAGLDRAAVLSLLASRAKFD